MRHFIILLILITGLNTGFAQQKRSEIQTKSSLALRYYNAKDFEKAAPLLKEVHELTRNSTYFRYYINSLISLNEFAEAESELQRQIKKQKTPRPEYYVHLGQVYKSQDRNEEAQEMFQDAINNIPANQGSFLTTANSFLSWGEYGLARDVYLKGRKTLPDQSFNYELARSYMYLRDYTNMMEEYLNLLEEGEKHLARVQSSLSTAMRLDIDDGLRDQFREQVLKRIQAEPNVIGYNRLLIWFFLQEKKFSSALRQSIALDKRTGAEDAQIAQLGDLALRNKEYVQAQKAYEYLMDKGEETSFFPQAYARNIHAKYMEYTNDSEGTLEQGKALADEFENGLLYLKIGPATLNLVREYAHLLAFYLNDTEDAIAVLEKGEKVPQLKPEELGQLKTEMADIYVYADDPWEAMLIYSQVIDANKKNTLRDEVKLKKAKLGYYMGNFSWAKAQLDVLKASTSKLTANDAMELSMLIGNNLNLDTTAVPLTMFAKADLRFFQNRSEEALTILDGLAETYPYHTLVDNILYRKAKIEMDNNNYELAAEYLQTIVTDFSYDLLGDDALFLLAEIYNYHLGQEEKAKELYKQMLTSYPGSVFTEESREKYRELRKVYPDKEPEGKEGLFMRAIENSEF
ncbi:tetratricopeptide repeat protein [Draconibacterium sp. IB214405]|uniref:tetratricopeptide repeat protein n=1 Tax=Draconibacterium sp. IB214405 TaxID=3097352 RepID=UPI002A0FC6A9|nr:tetratricopeptide repeat protein [Draconibacterium sp. IB214405]MDX8338181.1 tetratricopeptide repeat protein [Draconibacterium sp. IB214405]